MADPDYEVVAGSAAAFTLTLRKGPDALAITAANGFTPFAGDEALGLRVWPGDDQAALDFGDSSLEWLDADAATLTLSFAAADTAITPGDYPVQVAVAGIWRPAGVLRILPAPGSGVALPTYATYDELLRVAPWVAGLETPAGRSGFQEERHEARAMLDELALARDPAASSRGLAHFGAFAGGWASSAGAGHSRSDTLRDWLDEDRLVVTPDVRAYVCHLAAATIARQQVGQGQAAEYVALANYHQGEADRRAPLLLLGIDTDATPDGLADTWIPCHEIRAILG